MFGIRCGLVLLTLLLMVSPSLAADDVVMLPIANVLNGPDARQKLDSAVKFYFGTQPTPRILQDFGPVVANPKTNAFAKAAGTACDWVFLSALISLQDRVKQVGGNAVINIVSYYRKNEVSNETAFECHKGFLMAGVALKGDVVRLSDH